MPFRFQLNNTNGINNEMKAAFYSGHQTIELGSADAVRPGPAEVRLASAYCGICGTDVHIYHGKMDQRVHIPQPIGHEMSGIVQEVGAQVADFAPGDRVVVRPLDPCGDCPACKAGHAHICQNLKFLGIDTPGAFQESWTVPAHTLHRLPDAVSLKDGALVEPLAVACHDIRRGRVQAGEFVVVIGGGPIGMLIALTARQRGARVLLSEVNAGRLKLARELGIEAVDPSAMDLVARVEDRTDGAGADVVFEVSGSEAGIEMMTRLPRTRGRIVMVAIVPEKKPVDLFRFFWRELDLCGVRVYEPQDFEAAIALVAENVLPIDALITATYPLDQLGAAFARIAAGGEGMKVLIQCDDSQNGDTA